MDLLILLFIYLTSPLASGFTHNGFWYITELNEPK
jgi:hypothetical protein